MRKLKTFILKLAVISGNQLFELKNWIYEEEMEFMRLQIL